MKRFATWVFGLIALVMFTVPAPAQVYGTIVFTTSFPFYAGNAKMPAGTYRITPAADDNELLLLESEDSKFSAFIETEPTQAAEPHRSSDVTFHKYGSTDYLNRIWVEGQNVGLRVTPTKSEVRAGKLANANEHSIAAKKS